MYDMNGRYIFQTNQSLASKTLVPDVKDMSSSLFTTKLSNNKHALKLSLLKFQKWPGVVLNTLNIGIYDTRTSVK